MRSRNVSSFYWYLSLIFLLILVIGFGPQFFWRPLTGRPSLSIFAFFHALTGVAWIAMYLIQVRFIRRNKILNHMRMGIWTMWIGVGLVFSGFRMIYRFLQKFLDSGEAYMDPTGLIIGNGLSLFFFSLFVLLGYRYRRSPSIHKQSMSIATIFMLGPAIGRLSRYPFTRVLQDFGANEALWGVGGSILLFISLIIYSKKKLISSLGLGCFVFVLIVVSYFSMSGLGVEIIKKLY